MSTSSQKPYRVYRQPRRVRGDGSIQWGDPNTGGAAPGNGLPRRALRLTRRALFVVLALVCIWGAIAFMSFRSAVKVRNDALPASVKAALSPSDGPAFVDDRVTMLVGSDSSAHRARVGEVDPKAARADTLILMRVDVPSRTVSMLSIPRDLYVEIPGYGKEKINAAYANGGLPLSIKTVRNLTGIDINHVMQIDFDGFKEVVDALGGITIENPHPVRSGTPFDGRDWYFPKGTIMLNGKRALAYARMRKVDDATIAANEQEGTELGRARRQQRVIDAIVSEIATTDSIRRPREVPRAAVQPLVTDASATELMAMGFGRFWSKPTNNLRCRLGGDSQYNSAGESVLIPSEDNRAVIRMWLGKQAPVAPDTALSPGCVRESAATS